MANTPTIIDLDSEVWKFQFGNNMENKNIHNYSNMPTRISQELKV